MKRYGTCLKFVTIALALTAAVGVMIACATPEPMMLVEPTDSGTMADEIKSAPTVGTDESAATTSATPANATSGDGSAEALQDLRQTVDKLRDDVESLQADQATLSSSVSTLDERVSGVETGLETMARRASIRFSNFDAEIARIRNAMKTESTPEAAEAPASTSTTEPSEQPATEAPQEPAKRDIEAEVAVTVDNWRSAWQRRDLDAYMKLYDAKASVTRISVFDGGVVRRRTMAPPELRQRMARLLRQYARMEVIVRGFRVSNENGRMVATFQQEFTAWARPNDLRPAYTDKGVKTLAFTENGGQWKIVEENWVPIQR